MGTAEITNAANNSVTVRAVSANPVRRAFADGAAGAWFDPSDLDTMFQDSAGTTAVTGAGDPVGLIKDKSGNGNDATQDTDAARPTLQETTSGKRYLDFDGVDDTFLLVPSDFGFVNAQGTFLFSFFFDDVTDVNEIILGTSAAGNDMWFASVLGDDVSFRVDDNDGLQGTSYRTGASANEKIKVIADYESDNKLQLFVDEALRDSTGITPISIDNSFGVFTTRAKRSGHMFQFIYIAKLLSDSERNDLWGAL